MGIDPEVKSRSLVNLNISLLIIDLYVIIPHKMKLIIVALILLFSFSATVSSELSKPLKQLWDIPLGPVSYQIIDSYRRGSIQVDEVYYASRHYKGKPVKIFGYFCYPANSVKKLPGILLVHGGGGTAGLEGTLLWAKRGYAVLAIDLPGKGEQRWQARSTGPDMDVPILLRTKPDLTYNYLVHAVAAARNGITFLTQQIEVDPERIGMVGLSWGGVITLLTNGQDDRLKTAVNIFGAGYISEASTWQEHFNIMSNEEFQLWSDYIDPKNFLKTQHAPIFFITGTNDHCYYLPTFQKSYAQVTAPKKLLLIPNLKHSFLPYMRRIVWSWLDNKLKRSGSFPEVSLMPINTKGDKKIIVSVIATSTGRIKKATLYYTLGEPSRWTKKQWHSIASNYFQDGIYYFSLPTYLVSPELMFFVTAKDQQGAAASTPIRSIFKVNVFRERETYALSSPIQQINIHEPPLQLVGIKDAPKFPQLYFSKAANMYHILGLKADPNPAGIN